MSKRNRWHPASQFCGATDEQQVSSASRSTQAAHKRRIAKKLDEVLGPVDQDLPPPTDDQELQ